MRKELEKSLKEIEKINEIFSELLWYWRKNRNSMAKIYLKKLAKKLDL